MTDIGRHLAAATRQFADANSARIADAEGSRRIVATIATVTPGAAKDGNALVTVSYRGGEYLVNGYDRTYTPVVGHRVVCDLIGAQLLIDFSPIGMP